MLDVWGGGFMGCGVRESTVVESGIMGFRNKDLRKHNTTAPK